MMTDDLVKRLRGPAYQTAVDYKIKQEAADRIEQLEAEAQRLKAKCDLQATILRRLTPENHPDILFIHSILGDKDQNGMPEKLMVVPAYGCDFSYIYQRTDKITGPEW